MSRARETARLISNDTFRIDSNNAVGFGSTTPDAMFDINAGLAVAGIITASGGISGAVTGSTTQITVADESSDTTCFPVFVTAATGNLPPKSGSNLTFNSSNGTLTATTFSGDLTGNADTATTSTNVTVADESSDTTCFPLFVTAATGDLAPKSGSNLTFNSSTGTLETTNVTVTGDLTVQGTTTTLDTDLIGVDKVEVGANNSTVGLAVTQSGSGAIIAAYDGSSEVFRVNDGGSVGIGTDNPGSLVHAFGSYGTVRIENSNTAQYAASGIQLKGPAGDERSTKIVHGNSNAGGTETYFQIEQLNSSGSYVKTLLTYSYQYDYWAFNTGGTERLRINSNGDVLIGKTSGDHILDINASNDEIRLSKASESNYCGIQLDRDASGNAGGYFGLAGSTNHYISGSAQHDICVRSESNLLFSSGGGTERLRITSAGNVGIGTDNPGTNLEVIGGIKAKNTTGSATLTIQAKNDQLSGVHFSDDAATLGKIEYFHSDNSLRFNTNGSERLAILSSGYVGVGNNNPDQLIDVQGASNPQIKVSATNTGTNSAGFFIENAGQRNWQIWANRSDDRFKIGNNSRASINLVINGTNGYVGIATDAPLAKVHAFGNVRLEGDVEITPTNGGGEGGHISLRNPDKSSTGAEIDISTANNFRIFQLNNNSVMEMGQLSGTGGIVQFKTQNQIRMKIHATGEVTKPTNPCLKTLSGDTYASTNNLFTSPAVSVLQAGTDINIGNTGWTTSGTNAYSFVCPVTGVYAVHAHISLGNITQGARTIWSMAYTLGGGNFPLANYVEVIDVVLEDYMNYSYQEDWYFTAGTRVAMGKNGTGYQPGYGFHWGIRLVQ